MFKGTARILRRGEEYMYAYGLLKKKYPEDGEKPWDEGEIPIIAVSPKRIFWWGYRYDRRNRDYVEIAKDGKFTPRKARKNSL